MLRLILRGLVAMPLRIPVVRLQGQGTGRAAGSGDRAGHARLSNGPVSRHLLVAALLLAPLGSHAAGLNDTGIQFCGDATTNTADCAAVAADGGAYPRQDARYGRDAAAAAGKLTKIGGGEAGFDFSKIANNGTVLPASASLGSGASQWACTRDNVTGLIWEVKTADGGLRDMNWTYTWYDSVHNYGGNPGTASGTSNGETTGRYDNEKYVADVNETQLCGYSDLRMPTYSLHASSSSRRA